MLKESLKAPLFTDGFRLKEKKVPGFPTWEIHGEFFP
jgi:hypothetical protein